MSEHKVVDRLTDWRYLLGACAAMLIVAVVIASIGSLVAAHVESQQLHDSHEQVVVIRGQRDAANARADLANARADRITNDALARIHGLECAQYQQLRQGVLFARLVYDSPNATPAQKAAAKPFITEPKTPAGCP